MKVLQPILSKNKHLTKKIVIPCVYFLIYALLLSPTIVGAGQYWDWSFPYFKDQIHNYFDYKSYSWKNFGFGEPLGYNSDYLFRFISLKKLDTLGR